MMTVHSSQAEGEALLADLESGDAYQGQDIGFVLPSDLDSRIGDVVEDLEVGEMSRVVQTNKGYFVFKRTE
jgi:parvulin-like peptidyl-prolyl isomerase